VRDEYIGSRRGIAGVFVCGIYRARKTGDTGWAEVVVLWVVVVDFWFF